jgi:hypothetical protein
MKPVDRSEILPLGAYEQIRDRFRNRVIAEKRARRVSIGEHMSAVYENRDTVLLQIQEMLRTERITKASAVDHEIATYNELVPGDDELSMTLFIEINDKQERERLLVALAGMEEHVLLEIDGERFAAKAGHKDGAQEGRTTAVQYYKIPLSPDAAAKLRDRVATDVALVVDHDAYPARARLGDAALREVAGDLS